MRKGIRVSEFVVCIESDRRTYSIQGIQEDEGRVVVYTLRSTKETYDGYSSNHLMSKQLSKNPSRPNWTQETVSMFIDSSLMILY